MSDLRFLELHSLFMSRHYRAALYLLGDVEQAMQAAENSWLTCCMHQSDSLSDEMFAQALCAALLTYCHPLMETVPYQPQALIPQGKTGNLAAAESIGSLSTVQRQALVLGTICKRSQAQLAELLACDHKQAAEQLSQACQTVFHFSTTV